MLNQYVAGDGEMIVQVICLVNPHACRLSWDKSCIESALVPVNGVCEIQFSFIKEEVSDLCIYIFLQHNEFSKPKTKEQLLPLFC